LIFCYFFIKEKVGPARPEGKTEKIPVSLVLIDATRFSMLCSFLCSPKEMNQRKGAFFEGIFPPPIGGGKP